MFWVKFDLLSVNAFNLGKPKVLLSGNSLPNDNILDVTKPKALADDKLNVATMMIFSLW